MRHSRYGNLQDIIDSLPIKDHGKEYKAVPLPDPSTREVHRQYRKLLDQIAYNPDALLGVITANYQRLKAGDIDLVFPDGRATAWLRAMHMLTEVAVRLYEQNPYEFSQLEKIASSLGLIEEYIKTNRHCPPELKPQTIN